MPDLDIFTGSEACTAPISEATASRLIIDFINKDYHKNIYQNSARNY
jgi:hypothetical protein